MSFSVIRESRGKPGIITVHEPKDVQGPGRDAGIGGLRQPLGEARADPGGDSVNFTIQDADKCLPHLDKMVSMGNLMGGGPFGPDTTSESMQTAEPDSGGTSWEQCGLHKALPHFHCPPSSSIFALPFYNPGI